MQLEGTNRSSTKRKMAVAVKAPVFRIWMIVHTCRQQLEGYIRVLVGTDKGELTGISSNTTSRKLTEGEL